jgi:hypothetical protein
MTMQRKLAWLSVLWAGVSGTALAGSAMLDIDTHFGTNGLGRTAFIGDTAEITDRALTAGHKVSPRQCADRAQRPAWARASERRGSPPMGFSFDGASFVGPSDIQSRKSRFQLRSHSPQYQRNLGSELW